MLPGFDQAVCPYSSLSVPVRALTGPIVLEADKWALKFETRMAKTSKARNKLVTLERNFFLAISLCIPRNGQLRTGTSII
jgi:hypothetical protein